MNTQVASQDLQKKITSFLEDLARETDQARKSEAMQKYLDFAGRFHKYSPSNIFLIMLTRPDATQVAGFQTWRKLGRYVRKHEKGIAILAPLTQKDDPDDVNSTKVLRGFRVVFVFDVAQTDGKPLPPTPEWKSPEKNAELTVKLIRYAESKGISVTVKELPGEIQGISKGGAIEFSPDAGTKTLIHEIAHEIMHRTEGATSDPSLREMEAEAAAYSVARHFEIGNLNSSNYIVLNGSTSDSIKISLSKIQEAVTEIIGAIEISMDE